MKENKTEPKKNMKNFIHIEDNNNNRFVENTVVIINDMETIFKLHLKAIMVAVVWFWM